MTDDQPTESTVLLVFDPLTGTAAVLTYDRIISAKERRAMIPWSDMHILRQEKAGKFPKRLQLGENGRVGWSLREVLEWIEAKKAERHITTTGKVKDHHDQIKKDLDNDESHDDQDQRTRC